MLGMVWESSMHRPPSLSGVLQSTLNSPDPDGANREMPALFQLTSGPGTALLAYRAVLVPTALSG